jgi:Peptidase C39 family
MAAGVVDDFSWKAVAQSALSAGVTAGVGGALHTAGILSSASTAANVGSNGVSVTGSTAQAANSGGSWIATAGKAALSGGLSTAATQAIQGKWSWRDIAANAVGSAAGSVAGSAVGDALKNYEVGAFASRMASSFVGAAAADQVRATDPNYTRANTSSMFVSSLGNALGSTVADAMTSAPDQSAAETARLKRYEEAASEAEYVQQSDAILDRKAQEAWTTAREQQWVDQDDAILKRKAIDAASGDLNGADAQSDAWVAANGPGEVGHRSLRLPPRPLSAAEQRVKWDAMQVGGWSKRTGTGGPVWHLPSGAGSRGSNGVGYTDAALGDPSPDYGDALTAMNGGTPGAGSFSKPVTAAQFGRGLVDMFAKAPINLVPGLASEIANGYVGLYNVAAGNGPQVGTSNWRPLDYSDPMAGALGELAFGFAAPEAAAGLSATFRSVELTGSRSRFTFDDAGQLDRNGSRLVLNQGNAPTCAPTSCGMVLDTLGRPVDLADLIKSANVGPNGMTADRVATLLREQGVDASFRTRMTVQDLADATADGNPAIAAVTQGGGGHAIVVDGVTSRQGVSVVAIRDPWGQQYFEKVEVFNQRFLRQGIVINGTTK